MLGQLILAMIAVKNSHNINQMNIADNVILLIMINRIAAIALLSHKISNLINFGIVPFIFDNPADYGGIAKGDRLVLEGVREAVAGDGKVTVRNVTQGTAFTVSTVLSARQKTILLNGGLLAAVAAGAVR